MLKFAPHPKEIMDTPLHSPLSQDFLMARVMPATLTNPNLSNLLSVACIDNNINAVRV